MIPSESPAITCVPDISKMYFNKLNGMGTKEENQKLRVDRENKREIRPTKPIKIWDIWNTYKKQDIEDEEYDGDDVRHNLRIMQRKVKNEIENQDKN